MDHGHTPVVDGGGEAGDVGHHSPAHADNHVGAGQPEAGEAAAQLLDRAQALGLLPIIEEKRGLLDPGLHVDPHARLGNDGGLAGTRAAEASSGACLAPAPTSTGYDLSPDRRELPHGGAQVPAPEAGSAPPPPGRATSAGVEMSSTSTTTSASSS